MTASYEYDVHLPPNAEPGKKYPAIFTLHGKGSNEKNMHGLVEPLSDKFIIVHIRGDLPLGAGYQYYELRGLGNPVRESFDRSVRKLEDFLEEATVKYPIDATNRYLLGFSQGAILSMTLALTLGDRLKGIVALNGYIPEFVKTEYPLRSVENVSVFISHGQYDSVFPLEIGRANAAYFGGRTSRCVFRSYPADHGVSEENQKDFVEWLLQNINTTTDKE
ncbi:alpha/beta hydrolase [Cohnella faecalis]|uniref:Esterase n=1 Tax=Cohnella faecalis TaxID=2315694 RepID=A0A398CMX0_9BACL|nr:alpha/beta hydrolase-fold protein [Cohnella faecalis]RIE02138.1 esterase [Cohnella faecalis]